MARVLDVKDAMIYQFIIVARKHFNESINREIVRKTKTTLMQ